MVLLGMLQKLCVQMTMASKALLARRTQKSLVNVAKNACSSLARPKGSRAQMCALLVVQPSTTKMNASWQPRHGKNRLTIQKSRRVLYDPLVAFETESSRSSSTRTTQKVVPRASGQSASRRDVFRHRS